MPKIINRIVKTLVLSDFFINLGWGFLSPVFAIFILKNVAMQNISMAAEVAGLAALFYWVTKSVLEIPIGYFLDKKKGEKDDFWFMVIGEFIMAFVPLGYLFSTMPLHIYLLQMLYGVGMAMSLPSWLAIFTRHVDRGKEALEWGMETTGIGIGAGIAGGLGGMVAASFLFDILFLFVSLLNFISVIVLISIRNIVSVRGESKFILEKPVIEP